MKARINDHLNQSSFRKIDINMWQLVGFLKSQFPCVCVCVCARGGTIQYRKSSMCMCVYACLRVCIDNNVHICVRVLPSNSQRVIIYILLELDEVILSSINSKT